MRSCLPKSFKILINEKPLKLVAYKSKIDANKGLYAKYEKDKRKRGIELLIQV